MDNLDPLKEVTAKAVAGQDAELKKGVNVSKPDPAPSEDRITIDGDKVIAFGRAIQNLGKLFEEVNIVAVHKLFRAHCQVGVIEGILEQEKLWKDTSKRLTDSLKEDMAACQEARQNMNILLAVIKAFNAQEGRFNETIVKVKELVDLCDRLQKHKDSGLLELIIKLAAKDEKTDA